MSYKRLAFTDEALEEARQITQDVDLTSQDKFQEEDTLFAFEEIVENYNWMGENNEHDHRGTNSAY